MSVAAVCGFSLLVFVVWSICRWWLWSCRRSVHYLGKRKLEVSYRQRLCLAALTGTALAMLAVGSIGSQSVLDSSLRRAIDASRDLEDKLNLIETSTSELAEIANEVSRLADSIDCQDEQLEERFVELADEFQDAADSAAREIEDTGKEAGKWGDFASKVRRRLNLALLLVVAIVHLALMPATAYGTALSRRWSLWVASRFAFLICCAFSIFVAVEFAVGVELADFCRNPDQNFEQVILEHGNSLGQDAQDLVIYYSTCEGQNPIEDSLSDAAIAADALVEILDDLEASCTPTSVITRIQDQYASSVNLLETELYQQIQCPPINKDYQKVVHTATCRHFLRGLYFIAIVHATVLATLFVFLFAINWVCETILLEEEFWLLPHPEIFTLAPYRSERATNFASVTSTNLEEDDGNDIDLEFPNNDNVELTSRREIRI